MTAQDCAVLIGAVAAGVATCLAAVGALWVQLSKGQAAIQSHVAEVKQLVVEANGGPNRAQSGGPSAST